MGWRMEWGEIELESCRVLFVLGSKGGLIRVGAKGHFNLAHSDSNV